MKFVIFKKIRITFVSNQFVSVGRVCVCALFGSLGEFFLGDFGMSSDGVRLSQTLKILTSLNKESRPFCLQDIMSKFHNINSLTCDLNPRCDNGCAPFNGCRSFAWWNSHLCSRHLGNSFFLVGRPLPDPSPEPSPSRLPFLYFLVKE